MPDAHPPVQIAPDTRVGALLEARPDLEDTLVSLSPSFAALRNPVLRRTVAAIATLRQVAQVGKLPLAELINRLREAAGIGEQFTDGAASTGESAAAAPTGRRSSASPCRSSRRCGPFAT